MTAFRHLALSTLLLALFAPATAAGKQSLARIAETVERYVRSEFADLGEISEVQISSLDPRLNLPACALPLETFPAQGQRRLGNTTVGVRCEGARPWTLYVPVRIVSRVTVMAAARPLPRGSRLGAADLTPISRDAASLPHGYFVDAEALLGMELRRAVRAGEPLTPSVVSAPPLVQRGQQVLLSAGSDAISVSLQAQALEDGAAGELIRVRNLSSQKVLEAEVVGPHRVRVPL